MLNTLKDKIIGILDNGVKTVFTPAIGERANPADDVAERRTPRSGAVNAR